MDPIIANLSPENPIHVMPSLCMECMKGGETRLMLTNIPYFNDIILSSFLCEYCGNSNNSVQPASEVSDFGIRYTLTVQNLNDLNRQVIKSEYATIKVPEIELEIPPESQKGSSSTIEGFLSKTKDGILQLQTQRHEQNPELATQLENFVKKLDNIMLVEDTFTFLVEDPSGSSFIENPLAPKDDVHLKCEKYTRSTEEEDLLGISSLMEQVALEKNDVKHKECKPNINEDGSVITFEATCNACGKDAACNMKEVDIPFFKTILLMANVCDHCGYKDSEIKSCGGIAEKGQTIYLKMTDSDMDLSRDILKSETAHIEIPVLELSMTSGCLGGRFTTIEGLLTQVKDQLISTNPFGFGDSSEESHKSKMQYVVSGLQDIIDGNILADIIVSDPAGNSYVQNVYAPEDDPNLIITYYVRSEEDNDSLGITHMKTENYENDEVEDLKEVKS